MIELHAFYPCCLTCLNCVFTTKIVDSILSEYQTSYQKSYNSQNASLVMLEKWRKHLDKGRKCSALSIDLSKAFDNLKH